MDVTADEIDDLLYWTLQESWPSEQQLVSFARQRFGYVNEAGDCGVLYPGTDVCRGLLPGQIAIQHWREGVLTPVSEVAYLRVMAQYLKDRGELSLASNVPDPESRRRDKVILDVSQTTSVPLLIRCLKESLGLLYCSSHLSTLLHSICDDRLANMPKVLVVEGLKFLGSFLPATYEKLMEVLDSYRRTFPERQLVLCDDRPSGAGQGVVEIG